MNKNHKAADSGTTEILNVVIFYISKIVPTPLGFLTVLCKF